MECRNKCGKEAVGRSMYCGDTCKVAYNRNKPEAAIVTPVTESATVTQTMHERQCQANNETRSRDNQHTINTGKPKSFAELDTGEHNRVSLPGDGDYAGVVLYSTSPIYGEMP